MPNAGGKSVFVILLLYLCLNPVLGLAQNHYTLNIVAQPLSAALIELGYQTGVSIIFDKSITQNKSSTPLNGDYTLVEALHALLKHTNLQYHFINPQTVSLRRCETTFDCNANSRIANIKPETLPPPSTPAPALPKMDEVITIGKRITGSRIRRSDNDGSAPVDVLTLAEIEISGAQSLSGVLKYLPAVAGNSTSTFVTNGGDGTSSVALRGLPTNNTLVLLNGQRITSGGVKGKAVDLNTIPMSAIERIEIFKDGASAIYGSDAIAGVVNIITKSNYHGLDMELYTGQSSRSDLLTDSFKLTYGRQYPQGGLLLSLNYFDQEGIFSRDRELSNSANGLEHGGIDKRSSATPYARVTLNNQALILAEGFDGSDAAHFRSVTENDRYDFAQTTHAFLPSNQQNLFIRSQYDVAPHLLFYTDLLYTKTSAENQMAATPLFTAFEATPITIAADNIYNPFDVVLTDVRRRMLELGPRIFTYETITQQVAAGLNFETETWGWESGMYWSANEADENANGLLNAAHIRRALGPSANCLGTQTDDCVPLNLFGPPGSISPAQLDYIHTTATVEGENALKSFYFHFDSNIGELAGAPVKLAAGYEYRRETLAVRPDANLASGNTFGGNNLQASHGSRNINEVYLELLLPLFKNTSNLQSMELELAARYSDYSDFGDITNPKLSFKYRPSNAWLLRATYARGFRAPSLDQLFGNSHETFGFISDPCTRSENAGVLSGCEQLADASRTQFLIISGGESSLLPENSKSYSLGLIWSPPRLPNLQTSFDFYFIDQKNVVDSSAQFIVNQNARLGNFTDRIVRDNNGNLVQITATNLNIGRREIGGLDITFDYAFDENPYGKFRLSFNAAHIARFLDQIDPSAPRNNLAGYFSDEASEGNGALPKWKTNLGMSWSHQAYSASYTIHHIDSMRELAMSNAPSRRVNSWIIHDVQFSLFIEAALNARLSLGIDNIFDRAPPFIASAFNDNFDARTYDLTGRYFFLKLNKEF